MSEAQALLEKARRALDAAEQLLAAGHLDFSVSRTYYACLYTAQALLLSRNLQFSRHGQVIAQFGFHFAKTRELDPRFHRLLDQAFDLRQLADYQTEVTLSEEIVEALLAESRLFQETARAYLNPEQENASVE
jgi:uncharacterized protein (UPF0332 family)